MATVLATPAALAAPSSSHHTVKSLRHGIAWQRSGTWHWQDVAGVSRTPTEHAERRTRSVRYLSWMKRLWHHRRLHAKRNASRQDVPSVICRVFRASLCQNALHIAWRESRYQVTAWNSSDHGGLFQLGTTERAEYATIGYATAYQQVVAAHNLYLARGWEPWRL